MKTILSTIYITLAAICMPIYALAGSGLTVGDPLTVEEAYNKASANYDYLDNCDHTEYYVQGYITWILEANYTSGYIELYIGDNPDTSKLKISAMRMPGGAPITLPGYATKGDLIVVKGELINMQAGFDWWECRLNGAQMYRNNHMYFGCGTADRPYSVVESIKLANYRGDSSETFSDYVTGYVSSIDAISTQYQNATFILAQSKDEQNCSILVHRIQGIEGKPIDTEDYVQVGDILLIRTSVKTYYGTPECVYGNIIEIKRGTSEGGGGEGGNSSATASKKLIVSLTNGSEQSAVISPLTSLSLVEQNDADRLVISHKNGMKSAIDIQDIESMSITDIHTPDGVVDMGTSVAWAACNIGASSPTQTGFYFSWGENFSKTNFASTNYSIIGLKADDLHNQGYINDNNILTPEHDAATCILGQDWRTPTPQEYAELINNCIWQAATRDGVEGVLLTAKNGNTLFFPHSGCYAETFSVPQTCYYWTAGFSHFQGIIWGTQMFFAPGYHYNDGQARFYTTSQYGLYGMPIRAVYDPGCGEGHILPQNGQDPGQTPDTTVETRYISANYIITDTQTGRKSGTTSVEVHKQGNSYNVSAYGYTNQPCHYGYNDMIVGTFYYTYYNDYNKPVIGTTTYRIMFTIDF